MPEIGRKVGTPRRFLAATAALSLAAAPAAAWPGWRVLKNDSFVFFYRAGQEHLAREGLAALEVYRPLVEKATGNTFRRAPMVIEDVGTMSNGMTDIVNMNVHLFAYPPGADLLPGESWWAGLGVHEYTHLLHHATTAGGPGAVTRALGNVFNPMLMLPAWCSEGFAVQVESSYSPYSGRLNDGFYDAWLAAAAREKRFPSLLTATFAPFGYPGGVYYVAGGAFHGWLERTYGTGSLAVFYRTHASLWGSYLSAIFPGAGINRAAKRTYGKKVPALWDEWTRSATAQAAGWAMDGERVSRHGWEVGGLRVVDGTLYYARAWPVKTGAAQAFAFNAVVARDLATGRERTVVSTTSALTAPPRVVDGTLYYATAELERGWANTALLGYGFVSRLHARDLATGRDRVLVQAPIRAFGVRPGGAVLYTTDRRDGFGSDLWELPAGAARAGPARPLDLLVDGIEADGRRVVVTARRDHESFDLYELDPATGSATRLLDSPWLEKDPVLDGERLLFVSNRDKTYAVYARDFATGRVTRLTSGGWAASPAPDPRTGSLYLTGLTADGMDVFVKQAGASSTVAEDAAFAAAPPSPMPREFPPAPGVTRGGWPDRLRTLLPRAIHAPSLLFDGEVAGAGVLLVGADATGDLSYSLEPMWNWRRHRPMLTADAQSLFAAPLVLAASWDETEGRQAAVTADLPVLLRLSAGLQLLEVGVQAALSVPPSGTRTEVFDVPPERDLIPFAAAGAGWPRTVAQAVVWAPLERAAWGSLQNRTATVEDGAVWRYLGHSQALLQARAAQDPRRAASPFARIRGYKDELDARHGVEAALDLTRPLFEVRDGYWGFTSWVEDVSGGLFTDIAAGTGARTQWAYGVELMAEVGVTNILPGGVAMGGRVSRNREGKMSVEFVLESFVLGGAVSAGPPRDRGLAYGETRRRSGPPRGPWRRGRAPRV